MNTFTFNSQHTGDTLFNRNGLKLFDCILYGLKKDGYIRGNFFSCKNFSIIELPGELYKIDRKINPFTKNKYSLVNLNTAEEIGRYDFPLIDFSQKYKSTVTFNNHEPYSFYCRTEERRFFDSQKWASYEFIMSNMKHAINYFVKSTIVNPGLTSSREVLDGYAETDNENNLLLLLAGFFCFEERFRLTQENND